MRHKEDKKGSFRVSASYDAIFMDTENIDGYGTQNSTLHHEAEHLLHHDLAHAHFVAQSARGLNILAFCMLIKKTKSLRTIPLPAVAAPIIGVQYLSWLGDHHERRSDIAGYCATHGKK